MSQYENALRILRWEIQRNGTRTTAANSALATLLSVAETVLAPMRLPSSQASALPVAPSARSARLSDA